MFSRPFLFAIVLLSSAKLGGSVISLFPGDSPLFHTSSSGYIYQVYDGFQCYLGTNKCYKVILAKGPFDESLQFCVDRLGGSLVSIHSELENQIVKDLINATVQPDADTYYEMWIGMKLVRHSQNAVRIIGANWVDGSQMDYGNPVGRVPGTSPWAIGTGDTGGAEPNNWFGSEFCVQIRSEGWFDQRCKIAHIGTGFICQTYMEPILVH